MCFGLHVSSLRDDGSCKRENILWQRDHGEIRDDEARCGIIFSHHAIHVQMSDTWTPAFYTFHISSAFNFPSLKSHTVWSRKHLFEVFSGREVTEGENILYICNWWWYGDMLKNHWGKHYCWDGDQVNTVTRTSSCRTCTGSSLFCLSFAANTLPAPQWPF